MAVEILERADDCSFVGARGMVLLVWRGEGTARGIDRASLHLRARVRARGSALLLVVIAPQPGKPPDPATREAMDRAVRTSIPGVAGMGTIHEGSGFIAAFVRALVSGLQRLQAYGGGPLRVFASAAEAAPWAAKLLGDPEITKELVEEAVRVGRE